MIDNPDCESRGDSRINIIKVQRLHLGWTRQETVSNEQYTKKIIIGYRRKIVDPR